MFHFTLAVEIFSAGCSRSVSLTCFLSFSFPHISVFSCFGRVSFCLLVFWFSTSVAFAWFSFKLFYSLNSCSLFDSFPRFSFRFSALLLWLRCVGTAGSQSERSQSGAGGQHPAGERCSEDKPSCTRTGNKAREPHLEG